MRSRRLFSRTIGALVLALPRLELFGVSLAPRLGVFHSLPNSLRPVFAVVGRAKRAVTFNAKTHGPSLFGLVNAGVFGRVFMPFWAMRLEHIGIHRATLGDAIGSVVGIGSKEQVVGIYARRIVAPMANEQAIGDGSEVQFPRDSVGGECFPANAKVSISPLMMGTRRPNPTPVGFGYFLEESFAKCFGHSVKLTRAVS
jgi:hypothetical protein